MSDRPLMPKATAVWLVDNTALTFEQIADYCGLHELEVKGIADGDVAQGIKGLDPVASGQLSRSEIERGEADSKYRLKMAAPKVEIPEIQRKRAPRYTPVSRRQDRPDAIAWLLRNHPELTDGQVMKLVGTTKPTIEAIRNRTHWNSANIKPVDPVTLGLCSQMDLDAAVQRAARRVERERKQAEKEAIKAGTLMPAAESVAEAEAPPAPETAQIVRREPAPQAPAGEHGRADADLVPGTSASLPSGAEPDAASVFGSSKKPEPEAEEEIDPEHVFARLKKLKKTTEEDSSKE